MIPRKNRVPKQYFPVILRNPSRSGVYFRVVVAPEIHKKNNAFSVIIPKKYAKKAVTRNFFRRTAYGVINEYKDQIPKKTFVFIMQKPINTLGIEKKYDFQQQEVVKDIKNLIIQITNNHEKTS